jgi:hypothetical protein
MFNCLLHGWSHVEKPCPVCSPTHTYTSSGTAAPAPVYKTISLDNLNGSQFFGMQIWKVYEALQFAKRHGWNENIEDAGGIK